METFDDQSEEQIAGGFMKLSMTGAHDRSREQAAGLTSILSLFLLLLAFFILLNSLAQFEARRTHAVLGSLAATFNVSDPDGQSRTLGSFVGHLEAVAELEREITGLLRTLVGFGSFELIRSGTLLSTSIDNDVLFDDGASASQKLKDLAEPAAALLTAASDEVTIELTVYARPAGGKVIGARSVAIEAAAMRAGSVVRTFASFGVAARQMVVALEDGGPDQTRIEFRVLDKHVAVGESQ
ncbi:MAG: hypothetical protein O7G13_09570 [Alphaproteobacteria bacterium]|nr:hypothetical protein [Alphaproteobacteria bacterium]MCZ6839513.1 hypothetical protein [Alphaproteobacteria bacterium]